MFRGVVCECVTNNKTTETLTRTPSQTSPAMDFKPASDWMMNCAIAGFLALLLAGIVAFFAGSQWLLQYLFTKSDVAPIASVREALPPEAAPSAVPVVVTVLLIAILLYLCFRVITEDMGISLDGTSGDSGLGSTFGRFVV